MKRKLWSQMSQEEQAQRTSDRQAREKVNRELADLRAQVTGKGWRKYQKRLAADAAAKKATEKAAEPAPAAG